MAKKEVGKSPKKRSKVNVRVPKPLLSLEDLSMPFTFSNPGLESFRKSFKERVGKLKITGDQVKPPKKKSVKRKNKR